VQTAEGPLRRSRRLRAKMCIRTLRLSSEALRFSTAATAWLPARCSEGNSHDGSQEHPKHRSADQKETKLCRS
jgi:hypothetical protein